MQDKTEEFFMQHLTAPADKTEEFFMRGSRLRPQTPICLRRLGAPSLLLLNIYCKSVEFISIA